MRSIASPPPNAFLESEESFLDAWKDIEEVSVFISTVVILIKLLLDSSDPVSKQTGGGLSGRSL